MKKLFIPGPIHRVEVRLVTKKYLSRKFGAPGESIHGCYIAEDNIIYLDKNATPEFKLHTLMHEIQHMLQHQLGLLPVEQQCDAYATWAINFYKIQSIENLL